MRRIAAYVWIAVYRWAADTRQVLLWGHAMLALARFRVLPLFVAICLAHRFPLVADGGEQQKISEGGSHPVGQETSRDSTSQNEPAAVLQQAATASPPQEVEREKLARVWANEPTLVRLARERFGAELTETDARLFAAVASGEWADLRPTSEATFDPEEPASWAECPTINADRIVWLCTDPAAAKIIPNRGVWVRGANIRGQLNLYRAQVPFSLAFYDCLFNNGINLGHAKMQEVDIRNCCSAAISARAVQVAENFYLLTTSIFGGLDLIDANLGGDLDMSGGLAFHGLNKEDLEKQGIAINLHDAKVGGDIKLADNFRAVGQVRLIGATIGRSLTCSGGRFREAGQTAVDARHLTVGGNVSFNSKCVVEGGVQLRRSKVSGDLDLDGGRFIAASNDAFNGDLVDVGGQLLMGDGYHAEGETRFVNATIASDFDADNGHFLNPQGDALSLDGAIIGRSLRIAADAASPTDEAKDLPPGFLARGCLRLWGTQVNQDILADGALFDSPTGTAILACNLKVASRVVLTGCKAKGTVNLFGADIEHELDLRGSSFDGQQTYGNIALWANAIKVRGHVYCNQTEGAEPPYRFVAHGLTSFQFATIGMHWDLYGAELINPGGDALDASDCRVEGYVNVDTVKFVGRASFSRAKIDGLWILLHTVESENLELDMRFAHIWVIKDERLDDWPPAGKLQLEGLVYDHFDDDSPLDVNDRLKWLRRQYAPLKHELAKNFPTPSAASNHSQESATTPLTHDGARYGVVRTVYESPAPGMAAPSETADAITPDAIDRPNPPTAETASPSRSSASKEVGANVDDSQDGTSPSDLAALDPSGRRYITQPYTQLAAVYRAIGQDEQASTVLVARAERLGELAPPFSAQAMWYRYLGRLIGYGYEPFRAIKIGLTIVAIGAIVFAIGARRNLMAETKLAEQVLSGENELGLVSPTYPRFNALVYSLDVFLPFVDLNQVCYWIPGEKPSKPRKSRNCLMHLGTYSLKWSTLLHCYLWFQTLAGWTLCTLLAAAVTGIVES
ncbi:MAG: hypothetical protein IT425_00345 [Pirellulales bacterium]|nr:hypothetical protein [Pirellulales bacterium]